MNKLLTALCLIIVAGVGVFAQTTDEYQKNEFFAGFSSQALDSGRYTNINGFEGSYVRRINRYVGIKGDVSGAYRRERFDLPSVVFIGNGTFPINTTTTTTTTTTGTTTAAAAIRSENNYSLHNFLGGVQVRDNASQARLKPFAHALAGVAHYRSKFETSGGVIFGGPTRSGFSDTFEQTGFAAALGGGLDVRITDRFDIRAIQADYNPVRFDGYWSNNFRFSVGVVFK